MKKETLLTIGSIGAIVLNIVSAILNSIVSKEEQSMIIDKKVKDVLTDKNI